MRPAEQDSERLAHLCRLRRSRTHCRQHGLARGAEPGGHVRRRRGCRPRCLVERLRACRGCAPRPRALRRLLFLCAPPPLRASELRRGEHGAIVGRGSGRHWILRSTELAAGESRALTASRTRRYCSITYMTISTSNQHLAWLMLSYLAPRSAPVPARTPSSFVLSACRASSQPAPAQHNAWAPLWLPGAAATSVFGVCTAAARCCSLGGARGSEPKTRRLLSMQAAGRPGGPGAAGGGAPAGARLTRLHERPLCSPRALTQRRPPT